MNPLKRKPLPLSASLEKQVGAYALAGLAGLGAVCSPQSADAAVVYTKANVLLSPNSSYGIDLNGDGIVDFSLHNKLYYSPMFMTDASLAIDASHGDGFNINNSFYANALNFGAVIGTNLEFPLTPNEAAMAIHFTSTQGGDFEFDAGPFVNVQNKFLALKLSLNGKTYYGWARVDTYVKNAVTAELVDFAYESTPGKAIYAGEGIPRSSNASSSNEGSLGALAFGVSGLNPSRTEPAQ